MSQLSQIVQTPYTTVDNDHSLTFSLQNSTIPFPNKLYILLQDQKYYHVLQWRSNGFCFQILDMKKFMHDIVPFVFKQSKWTSFQRQLNVYGFRKITKGEDKDCYFHPYFRRNRQDLLNKMKRMPPKGSLVKYDELSMNIGSKPCSNRHSMKIPEIIEDLASPQRQFNCGSQDSLSTSYSWSSSEETKSMLVNDHLHAPVSIPLPLNQPGLYSSFGYCGDNVVSPMISPMMSPMMSPYFESSKFNDRTSNFSQISQRYCGLDFESANSYPENLPFMIEDRSLKPDFQSSYHTISAMAMENCGYSIGYEEKDEIFQDCSESYLQGNSNATPVKLEQQSVASWMVPLGIPLGVEELASDFTSDELEFLEILRMGSTEC